MGIVALPLRPVLRRAPLAALAASAAWSAAIVWWRADAVDHGTQLVPLLRVAAAVLAATAALCLEDVAEVLSDVSPFGRLRRRLLSVAVTAVLTMGAWVIIVGVAGSIVNDHDIPVGGLAVEIGALCACGWMIAALCIRYSCLRGSAARAGAAMLIVISFSAVHPSVLDAMWVSSGGDQWTAAHLRWAAIGAIALIALCALSRDPAARRVQQMEG